MNASFRLKSDMCAFLLQSVFTFFQEVGAENKFLALDTVCIRVQILWIRKGIWCLIHSNFC